MSKRLLSESQINRWAKLSGVKLNENYGMSGEREEDAPVDDMGGDMPAEEGGDLGGEDMGADMGAEGGESEMTVEDDQLMAMIEKAVENVLVKMGLGEEGGAEEGDEGGGEEGGDELAEPDAGGEAEMEAGEEGEDETLAEMVSDDEIINETLKRVIKRLVG